MGLGTMNKFVSTNLVNQLSESFSIHLYMFTREELLLPKSLFYRLKYFILYRMVSETKTDGLK